MEQKGQCSDEHERDWSHDSRELEDMLNRRPKNGIREREPVRGEREAEDASALLVEAQDQRVYRRCDAEAEQKHREWKDVRVADQPFAAPCSSRERAFPPSTRDS